MAVSTLYTGQKGNFRDRGIICQNCPKLVVGKCPKIRQMWTLKTEPETVRFALQNGGREHVQNRRFSKFPKNRKIRKIRENYSSVFEKSAFGQQTK